MELGNKRTEDTTERGRNDCWKNESDQGSKGR